MADISRRGFIGGAAAFMGLAGCRSFLASSGRPAVSFGVISDPHITTPESTFVLERTLRYFRDRKVDAVMICGDLSDWGLLSGFKYIAEAWNRVFPGDRAADGRRVQRLFCTGNHDFEGFWYGDMTADMHAQGYSEDEALVRLGMKKCWEEAFQEEYADIRRRTVNGYDFVSAEWPEGKSDTGFRLAPAWAATPPRSPHGSPRTAPPLIRRSRSSTSSTPRSAERSFPARPAPTPSLPRCRRSAMP